MSNETATTQQISTAMKITRQAVNKRLAGVRREIQAARGGWRKVFSTEDLPADIQAALAARHLNEATRAPRQGLGGIRQVAEPGATPDARAEQLSRRFEAKPETIKVDARVRLAIVREHEQLVARGFERESVIETVTREHGISEATLGRYLDLVKGEQEALWLYLLAPAYAGRTATADMSAEPWEILKGDYLRAERPTARACIQRLFNASAGKGWVLPKARTLQRRLKALPRAVKMLARYGSKALRESFPAQQRSRAALSALEIVNADGYKHNLWVRFADGEVVRAKTWFWQDVYSSKVLTWRTDKTEHTDMIRLSFGDLIERFGIPDAALLDNTMAAANKTMSGGVKHRFRFKVKDEEPDGVFKLLGCNVMWATPHHGQAKPVERAFGVGGIGEYIDKAPELSGAWTGANTLDKPDYDGKSRVIETAMLQAVIEREIAAWNARDGRRGAMARGRSFDALFDESYQAKPIRRATEAQRRLWLLATEPVRVARDGSIALDAGRIVGERLSNRYWSPELYELEGRQVAARFDPQRMHEGVHVYAIDGRYIGFAECDRPAGFNDQGAARERARARNTFVRNAKAMRVAEVRMDAFEAARGLSGAAPATIPPQASPERTVIAAQFRDPLERPRVQSRPLDAEAQVFMDQAEAAERAVPAVNVHELTDPQKQTFWKALDARRSGGEILSDGDAQFWAAWQDAPYFRFMREGDEEFERALALRSANAQ